MLKLHLRTWLADLLFLAIAVLLLLPLRAEAQEAAAEPIQLQLEVSINGQPRHKIAAFTAFGDGRMASTAQELGEIGIKAPSGAQPEDLITLDEIGGLNYIYDEPTQTIDIITGDENRRTEHLSAREIADEVAITPSDYGAVLNYTLFGSYGGEDIFTAYTANDASGVNATLDARLLSPYGVLSQTAILGMTLVGETEALRLETTYTYSDDDSLSRWRVGDIISGGTAWSRPVRMGGVQWQRAFSMRPDLVTNPLPIVSGSAAVPSSVDVYVNGIKSYTRDVAAGPYQIDNIPAVSGAGVAHVVTRDASGRETVQEVSFYSSPLLLKPGLSDFSVEAGVARSQYGVLSNDYDDNPFVSGTLRTGITDWLTAEGHAEVGKDLVNGGAGLMARVLDRGVVSGAVSGSLSDNGAGFQLYGSFETRIGPVLLRGRTQHAFNDYEDMASLTARNTYGGYDGYGLPYLSNSLFNFAPPRAIDSVTLSMPLKFDRSTVSATYLRYEQDDDDLTELITATYSRPLYGSAHLSATGFVDLNDSDNAGVYLGISMSLDDNISVQGGLNTHGKDIGGFAGASKPLSHQPGSWGFRVHDQEGDAAYRSATVGYRASAARLEAGVHQEPNGVRTTATVEGALTYIGGDVYASNRIDDSFAVVDAHVPGVKIERENQVVAVTNEDGKAIIPNLNSYQKNKIAIDPMDLPLNAEPATTYDYIRPGFRSGVYVDFEVEVAPPSAIVILKMANGTMVPAGSEVRLDGSDETFVVGYDGQAFIKGLQAVNTIHVTLENGTCSAQFGFEARGDAQPTIGPEVCQ